MTRSMTAFARAQCDAPWGRMTLEVRSVNQRYLEPVFRLPSTLYALETPLRECLRTHVHRGKIDVQLQLETATGTAPIQVNTARLEQLDQALSQVHMAIPGTALPDAIALLNYPGVIESGVADPAVVQSAAEALMDQALVDLIAAREREGARLAAMIETRLVEIEAQVASVYALMPEVIAHQQQRLSDRIAQAKLDVDEQRLAGEIALLVQKSDVTEELDRLTAHVDEVRVQLQQTVPVGRRLDFLMQELNREANTLGSKSVMPETTRCAVELKVLIEQIREQVQNVE